MEIELKKAREKFPSSDGATAALAEEVGEVAHALLDEPWPRVIEECVQVAVMALRIATEGDRTLNNHRDKKGIPRTCKFRGCGQPHGNYGPCALCYE